MGDRFCKEFKPILTAADITEEGLGVHAVRRLFGAQLKRKLLTKEDRAGSLGHDSESETTERDCDPHEFEALFEVIMKLVARGRATPTAEPRAQESVMIA